MKDSGLLLTFSPSSWWSMSGIRAENLSQVNILNCANKCITSPASDKMNYVIHRHYLDPTLDTPDPAGFGQGSVRAAILCSFLSIYAWVSSCQTFKKGNNDDTKIQGGCALFSLKRYREGFEAAFTDVPGGEYQQSEPPFQGMTRSRWKGTTFCFLDNQMQYWGEQKKKIQWKICCHYLVICVCNI